MAASVIWNSSVFHLVFEGLHERNRLIAMVPHLSRPIPFLLPAYQGDQRPAWMLKIGLWLYDLLAGSHNIAKHQWLSPQEALAKAPTLKNEGLKGCGLYYDAQVNDARLVLENILAAEQSGAKCLNYHQVTEIDEEAFQAIESIIGMTFEKKRNSSSPSAW
jgi:glycerol-3-phosphate dehydrogenase